MTILSKDFATIIVSSLYENTGGSSPTTSLQSQTISMPAGIEGSIPVITTYPASAASYTSRGIRLCTQGEVDTLKNERFAGLPALAAESALFQLLYAGNYGTPLKVYAGGDYIAAWYSNVGVGFHYFVGYDYTNPPTQTITVSALQKVY